MTPVERALWAKKAYQIGWYATRQAMLKRGATMQDVAWALVVVLIAQGKERHETAA